VVAFLAVSLALARLLATAGAERTAAIEAIEKQAGDEIRVLRIDGPSRLALGPRTGTARVVWSTPAKRLPVVQCASLRRSGDLLGGFEVSVRSVSRPIGREAGC
jgi:hypothetical protein